MRLPASRCPALHPRRSRRSEHRERRECRRHRQPIPRRVGRGRVINYASNSMKYREARLYRTQRYHLKATCEAQRFCEKSAAPPKCRMRRRRRGWRHFRLRLTSCAYVQDGYYRALRRLLYVTTCIESTHKTRYHQKPSSGAVRRRYGTTRWFAARRHAAFPTHETHTESA